MPDPDLEMGGGGGGAGPPDSKIRVGEGVGSSLQKKIFWPFRPQFGLKIREGAGSPGPLPWIRHCTTILLYNN